MFGTHERAGGRSGLENSMAIVADRAAAVCVCVCVVAPSEKQKLRPISGGRPFGDANIVMAGLILDFRWCRLMGPVGLWRALRSLRI
jgi:hypothetical protein